MDWNPRLHRFAAKGSLSACCVSKEIFYPWQRLGTRRQNERYSKKHCRRSDLGTHSNIRLKKVYIPMQMVQRRVHPRLSPVANIETVPYRQTNTVAIVKYRFVRRRNLAHPNFWGHTRATSLSRVIKYSYIFRWEELREWWLSRYELAYRQTGNQHFLRVSARNTFTSRILLCSPTICWYKSSQGEVQPCRTNWNIPWTPETDWDGERSRSST